MRIAAIDLGSNSFHMLVAQVLGSSSFEIVLQEKMMTQLGKHAFLSGRLDAKTMERGLQCLDEFRRLALARRVDRTLAVATSALREAENGQEFLRRAGEEIGLSVRLISGKEEARLIHLAVSRHVDLGSEKALLIDIGGGSVELTVANATEIFYWTSAKLGFLRLQSRFVNSDPMSKKSMRSMSEFVQQTLTTPIAKIRKHQPKRVIGTSGSITTLLRLAQQLRSKSEAEVQPPDEVSREDLRAILGELLKLPSLDRVKKFDLDPLRAEALPAGLICLDAILESAGARSLTVCPVALREGVIYDFIARSQPKPAAISMDGDLRLQAVVDLAARCDYPVDHSHQVARLAQQVFRATSSLHLLGENEERLLQYAALLHDIGYHIGYSKHHKHAYYLLMNCDLRGFTPEERSVLAHLVRYHRRASPKKSHASFAALEPEARKVVKALAAILRVADGLDRSHFSAVEELKCVVNRKKVQFRVVASSFSNIKMDLWSARKHAAYFEKLFGVKTAFSVARPPRKAPSSAGATGPVST